MSDKLKRVRKRHKELRRRLVAKCLELTHEVFNLRKELSVLAEEHAERIDAIRQGHALDMASVHRKYLGICDGTSSTVQEVYRVNSEIRAQVALLSKQLAQTQAHG